MSNNGLGSNPQAGGFALSLIAVALSNAVPEPPIGGVMAALNNEDNPVDAIWASALVADGNGTGTEIDPYSFRGARYNAKLGKQILLKDDGVYQLTNSFRSRGDSYDDYTYNTWTSLDVLNPSGANPRLVIYAAESPTQESERIIIRGEKGTQPTIDAQDGVISHGDIDYITYRSLKVINGQAAFVVSSKGAAYHNHFDLIDGVMSQGGDNVGLIKVSGSLAEHTKISRSVIVGPGLYEGGAGVNGNTACIYMRHVNHIEVTNCTLSNAPFGIYYKHPNDASLADNGIVTILFKDLMIFNTDRTGGNQFAFNGAVVENCIMNGVHIGNTGGLGTNEVTGGNNNVFKNITFTGGITYDDNTESLGEPEAANGNQLIDCIMSGYGLWPYSNTLTSTNTSNYNLYANDINYKGISYGLASWQAASTPSGQDVNSLAGTPTYAVVPDENNPLTYALDPTSLGFGTGSVGTDIGANTSSVGAPQ